VARQPGGGGRRILVSADRNPNVRGALVTGLISALPAPKLTELAAQIDAGQVKTVVSVGEDLAAAGLTAAQLAKVSSSTSARTPTPRATRRRSCSRRSRCSRRAARS
jgi:hypothetical protein